VRFIALYSLNGSFQPPQTFSFNSVFVPTTTYGRESCIMTERIMSQIQAAEIRFLRRVTMRHFAAKCAVVKSVKPWISRHLRYVGSTMWPECPRRGWWGKSYWPHSRKSGPDVDHGTGGVIAFLMLLWSSLGVESAELSEIAVDREEFQATLELLCLATLSRGKSRVKINEWIFDYMRFSIFRTETLAEFVTFSSFLRFRATVYGD